MQLLQPIESRRLILRTLTAEDDLGLYMGWLRDAEVVRYMEARFQEHSDETTRAFVDGLNASPDNLFLGIFFKEGGDHIGNVKLGPINPHHRHATIGIVIGDRGQWGKNCASEAIRALSDYALGQMSLHKVFAGFYGGNVASTAAFAKAGFVEEARLRDHWNADGQWQDGVLMSRFANPDGA